jgi:hypothetical protein
MMMRLIPEQLPARRMRATYLTEIKMAYFE